LRACSRRRRAIGVPRNVSRFFDGKWLFFACKPSFNENGLAQREEKSRFERTVSWGICESKNLYIEVQRLWILIVVDLSLTSHLPQVFVVNG